MIIDANVLLYARNADDPRHAQAKNWLEDALNGDTRVGLPWQSLVAFVRISTNPRASREPLTPDEAWQQVEEWVTAPRSWVPEPTSGYGRVLGRLIQQHQVRGPLVTDAQLAALALDHGVPVVSTDTDFARFPQLRWINPLLTSG